MIAVLRDSWALLFGLLLLMLGNGLQGTLLGVRGAIEGMSPAALSYVMSAYFLGLFIGARTAPGLIRRVGHVRVFAALASLISAAFILYAAIPTPWAWAAMRLLVGFCFSGVYIVAESWMNDKATNETRGQALSAYMLVQMGGIVIAQGLLVTADPGDYTLFVLISVLVSVAVAPILLSASPAPVFQTTKPMSLSQLYKVSPLGCVASFLLGGLFAAMFGMASVYGVEVGLSLGEISIFVGAFYVGGLVLQYPIGWMSDRMDRRVLIVAVCAVGAAAAAAAIAMSSLWALAPLAVLIGGAANPLYSLILAHANDFLEPEDMAAASGGLIVLNAVGAIGGPLAVGAMMDALGPNGFFVYLCALLVAVSLYGSWRMTRRAAPAVDETGHYGPIAMQASAVAIEAAQEVYIDQIAADAEEDDATRGAQTQPA